ncbi:hypothetical protein DV532_16455 [Pseudomonas sp. Leaf58]|uniref:hypothetical protein n=1 Tax=Pseudomonas sp. Leaf58 TaxID=1736226 RepID=UPI0006F7D019|nr:hypothetical protein [Pseudomonas sp. Leaf58]AYG45792.1 hypothetical protein DV532_16455 [Pseudomonas sp. Leaf58]KQN58997.1 hypothetical protein ASF02_19195 [Pseudomonas sp. Leaf58]
MNTKLSPVDHTPSAHKANGFIELTGTLYRPDGKASRKLKAQSLREVTFSKMAITGRGKDGPDDWYHITLSSNSEFKLNKNKFDANTMRSQLDIKLEKEGITISALATKGYINITEISNLIIMGNYHLTYDEGTGTIHTISGTFRITP